tara:strand:- start:1257 stop:2366 length:1110 start_codon:yes stop_codon:yes gene_type:complete
MKVLVTGSDGFIGKNICTFLKERNYIVLTVNRKTDKREFISNIEEAEFIYHLAGINRPDNIDEFRSGNVDLTSFITDHLIKLKKNIPIVYASSKQAEYDNEYGKSKLLGEKLILNYADTSDAKSYIYRFPNVFGKWCKPNYNSFVATFCHNVINEKDIIINDKKAKITLVYIDDLCESLIGLLDGKSKSGFCKVPIEYNTTVGEVADMILSFKNSRTNLLTSQVGKGLERALYSTYLSYIEPKDFNYRIPSHPDERGLFCEMLKTKDSGQFSFFTAHPGITRGGHYHHSKNEKFLVIKGEASFKFENIITGERHQIMVNESSLEIVETVPGWSHDITNTGNDELIVMLWANEIFDHQKPDTISRPLFED